jgi:hypothetical protein
MVTTRAWLSALSLSLLCLASCSKEICSDLDDNDGDGAIDCADEDCDGQDGGAVICEFSAELSCADGGDNDVDGFSDCADEDCDGQEVEAGNFCEFGTEVTCDDLFDNDGDFIDLAESNIDCSDDDCAGQQGVDFFGVTGTCEAAEVTCDDGFDNDLDAKTDCDDSDCEGVFPCP